MERRLEIRPEMPAISPLISGFDYASLPADVSTEAKAAAERIKGHERGARAAVISAGNELLRIKDRLLHHGMFGKWLSAEFGYTERTAENYMNAARLTAKSETVSVLKPKTLYQLAAPSTPELLKQDIIDRFNAGEVISDRDVVAAISEARFLQRQEQRKAEQRAEVAKLSPRAKKTRAQKEAERAKEKAAWKKKQAEEETAASRAVELIAGNISPNFHKQLAVLILESGYRFQSKTLLGRLEAAMAQRGDPRTLWEHQLDNLDAVMDPIEREYMTEKAPFEQRLALVKKVMLVVGIAPADIAVG
jgi:hypothetical protein